MPDDPHILSGLLLEWTNQIVSRKMLSNTSRIKFKSEIPGGHWEEYVFHSAVPLRGEEQDDGRSFLYPIVCRRSGPRLLLLSISRPIVEYLLENELKTIFLPRLRRVSIAVDELVKALVNKPTIYSLSFVHARTPAFGSSLRSLSFYGEDLAEASLLREHVSLMNFFACGIRRTTGGNELVRIAADGGISFYSTSFDKFLEIEEVLRYLRQEAYLISGILE